MKKLIKEFFLIFLFFSCGGDASKKILIEGITMTELNVRIVQNSNSTIVDVLDAGDVVRIIAFDEEYDDNGISWCQIKLDRSEIFDGKEITTAWVAYKSKSLPWIVSVESYDKIKRMYEMEYEKEPNEILTGAKLWLTQAIYDFTYEDYLRDIKHEFDSRTAENKYPNEKDDPKDKYEVVSPNYSVDFTSGRRYPQYCRSRISTASKEREETALYAVIFNQSPRTIHFFRQDRRTNRGSFVKDFDLSSRLKSNIKSLERKTYKTKIYVSDYYGYKERLPLSYDAIRLRPQSGRQRYIVYNNNNYTSSDLDNLYNLYVKEQY